MGLLVVLTALYWYAWFIFCDLCLAESSASDWFSVILIDSTEILSLQFVLLLLVWVVCARYDWNHVR